MVKLNSDFLINGALINYGVFCEELQLDFVNWISLPSEHMLGKVFAWRKLGRDQAKAAFAHPLKLGLVQAGVSEERIPDVLNIASKHAFDEFSKYNLEYFSDNYGGEKISPRRLSDRDWAKFMQFIGRLPDPWVMLPDSLNSAVAKRELGSGMCYLVFKRDKKSYPIISSICFTETESPTPFNSHSGLIGIWGQIAVRCPVTDDLLRSMAYEVTRRIAFLDGLYK